jgi:hypothetical protein
MWIPFLFLNRGKESMFNIYREKEKGFLSLCVFYI